MNSDKGEMNIFLNVWPEILTVLTGEDKENKDMPEYFRHWFRKVLNYNVTGGKMNRGLYVVDTFKILAQSSGNEVNEDDIKRACILGWCVEMLQAFLLIADDIMDESEVRRGLPCWYRTNNLGPKAVNDAFLVETAIYEILARYFRKENYYIEIVELFHDMTNNTLKGQYLDLTSDKDYDGDKETKLSIASAFTPERYKCIVKYKTAYYSFYLPVAAAMLVSGVKNKEIFDKAKDILLPIGEYFQIQDDYLDCFGASDVIGKIGNDIQEGKCTWLAIQALQRLSEEDKVTFERCYGSQNNEHVEQIKQFYTDVNLQEIFEQYEDNSYTSIKNRIDAMEEEEFRCIFNNVLQKIYRRVH